MQYSTLLFTLLFSFTLCAQTYEPFIQDSTLWDVVLWTGSGANDNEGCSQLYQFYFGDDVQINNMTYTELRKRQMFSNGILNCGEYYYSSVEGIVDSYIREDTVQRKVWLLESDLQNEFLLYDYSLGIGDTLDRQDNIDLAETPLIIDTIDLFLCFDGVYRKRFYLIDHFWFIEGLGGLTGPRHLLTPQFGWQYQVECMTTKESIDSGMFQCGSLWNDVMDLETDQITIVPNPVKDKLSIKSNSAIGQLTIINPLGQVVYSNNHLKNDIELDLSHLSPGVYILNTSVGFSKQILVFE